MEKAINSYKTRETLVKVVKRVSNPTKTTWWMDQISINDEMLFDSGAYSWDGVRHVENIVYLNGQSDFNRWNRKARTREYDFIKEEMNKHWRLYKAYSDLQFTMLY